MYHILVVDDESRIRALIRKYAEFDGHSVTEAGDGMEAVCLCRRESYDLIIMDIMMPELDGFSACREIRKRSDIPIIMLSARSEEFDMLTGYENGADDYVTKPFSPGVLVKRVEALLRRVNKNDLDKNEKEVSDLVFDDEAHEVRLEGKEIDLTLKEYKILKKFLESPGRVFSREQLLDSIWGFDFSGDVRTVDSHVARLRTKLGEWGNKHLKTVYGIGYKIEED